MTINHSWKLAANGIKLIFIGLILAAGVMLMQSLRAADPEPIDLTSCYNFTIPAYSAVSRAARDMAKASAVVDTYNIVYGASTNYMAPTNQNQSQCIVSGVTSCAVDVFQRVATNIAPPVVMATEGTCPNKVRLSWQSEIMHGQTDWQHWKNMTSIRR